LIPGKQEENECPQGIIDSLVSFGKMSTVCGSSLRFFSAISTVRTAIALILSRHGAVVSIQAHGNGAMRIAFLSKSDDGFTFALGEMPVTSGWCLHGWYSPHHSNAFWLSFLVMGVALGS
jgi:hypothetical protein